MGRFRRTRKGIELRLEPGETGVLRQVVQELAGLLAADTDAAGTAAVGGDPLEALIGLGAPDAPARGLPADPVLARLFPDGYRDDPAAAAELRRYTESDLRRGKLAAATVVLDALASGSGRLLLDEVAAQAWLGVLNDVRLALGTRLEVTEETYAEFDQLSGDSPRAPALALFGWLGWLQETLVEALSRG